MANRNGLISSKDVAATGAVASNFFVRKGDPLQSPLTLVSPDGSKVGTIAQNNNGNMVMYSDPAGYLYLGSGSVFYPSPNGSVNAQLAVENDGDVGFYQGTNGTLFLGGATGRVALANLDATPVVQIGTGNGTVYDTVYTKPVVQTEVVAETTGSIQLGGSNPGFIDVGLPGAGYYQFELSAEAITTKGAGTAVDIFCTDPGGVSVINFTSNSVSADTILGGGSGGFVLSSGIFPVNGAQTIRLHMETANISDGSIAAAVWVGTWTIRLTRYGQSL